MATTAYEHDADGSKFIPATQRPDGTWRKPRRIRDGYVPQEEVPLYESKGKQFAARQNTGLPVGLTPEIVAEAQKQRKGHTGTIQPVPGMIINVEKKKKKKKTVSSPHEQTNEETNLGLRISNGPVKCVEEAAEKLAKCEIIEPTFSSSPSQPLNNSVSSQVDPTKRLKNLRKKLREIETLEEKVKAGVLKTPDREQKEKISKKNDILNEINILEKNNK